MLRFSLIKWSCLLLLALRCHAADVLSNLAQPAQNSQVAISYNSWQASSFQLAENSSEYLVSSIKLRLHQVIPNASLSFRIVGETAMRPNFSHVKVEFNAPVFSGNTVQTVTLTVKSSSPNVILPGQRYWIVGSITQLDYDAAAPNGLVYWSYSNNSAADATPAPGWTFGSQVATGGTGGSNWLLETATPFSFALDAATIVPTSPTAPATLSNLTQPAQDSVEAIAFNSWQASSFQLAAMATEYRVNAISLRLRQVAANASLRFRIVGEINARPDLTNVKAEFAAPSFTGGTTQYVTLSVASASPVILQPGQQYWLVGGIAQNDPNAATPNGLIYWSYSQNSTTDAPPAAGWSFGSRVASSGSNGSSWNLQTATPFTFAIHANPVATGMTLANWRSLNPGGPADEATFLAADHNQNGLNGLLDFAFNANRAYLPTLSRTEAGSFVLEYVRWKQAPELTWIIEKSETLAAASWQTVTGLPTTIADLTAESETVRVQLPSAATSQLFYRVVVRKL